MRPSSSSTQKYEFIPLYRKFTKIVRIPPGTSTGRRRFVGQTQGMHRLSVKYATGINDKVREQGNNSSPPLKREPGSASPALSIPGRWESAPNFHRRELCVIIEQLVNTLRRVRILVNSLGLLYTNKEYDCRAPCLTARFRTH